MMNEEGTSITSPPDIRTQTDCALLLETPVTAEERVKPEWEESVPAEPMHVIQHPAYLIQDPPEDLDWFYAEEWQKAEAEADAEIAAGEVLAFSSVEDLIADLES